MAVLFLEEKFQLQSIVPNVCLSRCCLISNKPSMLIFFSFWNILNLNCQILKNKRNLVSLVRHGNYRSLGALIDLHLMAYLIGSINIYGVKKTFVCFFVGPLKAYLHDRFRSADLE
jgi:hypothetical protein